MAIRLIECHRILKDTESLYLHCDPTMSHYLKMVLDCIFKEENFKNEIIWHYQTSGNVKNWFVKNHDNVLFYSKSSNNYFNLLKDKRYTKSKSRKAGIQNLGQGDKEFFEDGGGVYQFTNMEDVWRIPYINSQSKERTGYPTQKPLALLDRIIQASSDEDDVVLDPFCGCATACISAELNHRQWVGIDVSKIAYHLVNERMKKEVENNIDFKKNGESIKTIFREDIPERTDTIKNPIKKSEVKHTLFGKQEGICNGCKNRFDFRHFEIDHIIPQVKGGTDNIENLQLLCGHCNKIKSDNDMSYLKAKLKERGYLI